MDKKTEIPGEDAAVTAADVGVSAEQLEAWKKEYGKIVGVPMDEQWFVFKRPNWPILGRFFDAAAKGEVAEASLNLVLDTLLWPAREKFGELMGENAALPLLLGTKLQNLFNVTGVGDVKNL